MISLVVLKFALLKSELHTIIRISNDQQVLWRHPTASGYFIRPKISKISQEDQEDQKACRKKRSSDESKRENQRKLERNVESYLHNTVTGGGSKSILSKILQLCNNLLIADLTVHNSVSTFKEAPALTASWLLPILELHYWLIKTKVPFKPSSILVSITGLLVMYILNALFLPPESLKTLSSISSA